MRARTIVVALLLVFACGYQDVAGDRHTAATYVIEQAEPNKLVLRTVGCPTETKVLTWDPTKEKRSRSGTDFACLGALKKGQTIDDVRQRIKQGCMPGKVYRTELAGCDANDVEWKFEGTSCPTEPGRKE